MEGNERYVSGKIGDPNIDAPFEATADGQKNSKNKDFVEAVVDRNVRITVADIRERSKILTDLEKEGKSKSSVPSIP